MSCSCTMMRVGLSRVTWNCIFLALYELSVIVAPYPSTDYEYNLQFDDTVTHFTIEIKN